MSTLKRMMAGAVGGLAGAAIMGPLHSLATRANKDGGSSGEDATEKVAKTVTRAITGHKPSGAQQKNGALFVHYAFGATMGALFGLASEVVPGTRTGLGTLFGAAVYVGAHALTVPLLGLAPGVAENGLAQEGAELAAHLAYGMVTDRVTKLLS
jgi:putative membrane protein